MSHKIERIAEIVGAAREREGWSREELAERSGVPAQAIVDLEGRRRGITTGALGDLADALSLDGVALLRGEEVPRRRPSVFLRHAAAQDFDDRDAARLDAALEQGRYLANLRSLLAQPELALQAGVFERAGAPGDTPAQDGYRLASRVRQWLSEPEAPLGDMAALLEERFGVAVLVVDLASPRITAVGVCSERAAAVVLNASDPYRAINPLLDRVYLAHELCHVLFDPCRGGVQVVLDRDGDRKIHQDEQRARAFAAELLLPAAGLARLLGPPAGLTETRAAKDAVSRVRSRFGTPHEIAVNHLCNVGYIDRALRDWVVAAKSEFTGSQPPLRLPAPEAPSRAVTALVERAHRQVLLMDGEARGMLGIDRLAPLPWDELEL